jgi:hypothetical protein
MPTTTTKDGSSIFEKAIALNLSIGALSLTRKLPQEAILIRAGADGSTTEESRVKSSKKLWDNCEQVDALATHRNAIGKWVRQRTLPSPIRAGILLLPKTLIDEADQYLTNMADEYTALGEKFIQVWDEAIAREQLALGPNFNRADYDTPETIRARLKVDWSYVSFGVAEDLPAEIRLREQEKARGRLNEAVDTIQAVLRGEMLKLVNSVTEKLTGGRDGNKPKIFRDSLVENIKDFMKTFKDRNITDDAELDALVDRARALLGNVDPQALRDSESLRTSVATGFAEIQKQLDGMMVESGSRLITFDDEV